MSRSPAKSGNATAMKSLKEKWSSIVQLVREKGEKGIGGSSTVTTSRMLDSLFPKVVSELTYSLRAEWGGGMKGFFDGSGCI